MNHQCNCLRCKINSAEDKLITTQKFDPFVEQPIPIKNNSTPIADLVIEDLKKRKEIGLSRYGTYLQANNNRDALRDLYEELLDAVQYLRQVMEENK